jgi:hypothetical protein
VAGLLMLSGLFAPLEAGAAGPAMQQSASAGEREATVNASSGSLDYAIAIESPPGPRGALPPLALTYSSGSGDGARATGSPASAGISRPESSSAPPASAHPTSPTANTSR